MIGRSRSRRDRSGRRLWRSGSTGPSGERRLERRHDAAGGGDAACSPPRIASLPIASPPIAPLLLSLGAAIVCCALVLAPPARAIYGPAAGGLGADIVSVDRASDEQANAPSTDADISANGRYVVFQTRSTDFFENDGVSGGDPEPAGACREGGVFRYDRNTGELALVADGTEVATNAKGECDPSQLVFRGAENPSVSANGQYVAFSTAQQLVPQDTNENIDVYVRNMDVPLSADRANSGAYTLVSARSGGEEPAVYAPRNPPLKDAEPGADVWPNTSISANGRYVVFRTAESMSDLPDQATVETPREQLFVRDLQTKTTTLISVEKKGESDEGGPAGGAIGPATISADGSTVAWVSMNAPEQTVFLSGEDPSRTTGYYLWRRWQEPGATSRRITGIADPEDPECPSEGAIEAANHTITGPCYGPLTYPEGQLVPIFGTAPGLSEDGYTVAFLAAAALRPDVTKADGLDLFLTNMRPDVTRKAGTRELTLGVSSGAQGSTQSIESIALSPDGSTIAFTTPRDSFVLSEPDPIGTFPPLPTLSDLYVIHLGADTLERAAVGYEGGELNGSMSIDPTLAQEGSTVAFVSAASNLVYGDANGFADAFTATLQAPGGTAAPPTGVNAGVGGFSLSGISSPELGVSVKRAKDGGVTLLVETPGPGKLTAKALGTIPKTAAAKTSKQARASSVLARSSKTKAAKKRATAKKRSPPPVLLAGASATARSEGTTTLTLKISSKYVSDLQRAGKLKANITIDYTPTNSAESALTDEVSATFVTASPAKKSPKKGKAKK